MPDSESNSDDDFERKPNLSDVQLQLLSSRMHGYCLKAKGWRKLIENEYLKRLTNMFA